MSQHKRTSSERGEGGQFKKRLTVLAGEEDVDVDAELAAPDSENVDVSLDFLYSSWWNKGTCVKFILILLSPARGRGRGAPVEGTCRPWTHPQLRQGGGLLPGLVVPDARHSGEAHRDAVRRVRLRLRELGPGNFPHLALLGKKHNTKGKLKGV